MHEFLEVNDFRDFSMILHDVSNLYEFLDGKIASDDEVRFTKDDVVCYLVLFGLSVSNQVARSYMLTQYSID